jgi:transposase-like protein
MGGYGFDCVYLARVDWAMIALSCPGCGDTASVGRHGFNRNGTARCRCKACTKTFTLNGRPRVLSREKQEQIERALAERMSQRGIARALGVSRDTIRTVRKKGQSVS